MAARRDIEAALCGRGWTAGFVNLLVRGDRRGVLGDWLDPRHPAAMAPAAQSGGKWPGRGKVAAPGVPAGNSTRRLRAATDRVHKASRGCAAARM